MTPKKKDTIRLVVRLIIGGLFIATGWMKVSGMTETIGFFHAFGIPAFLAYVVSYAELLGGVAIVLGLWTELVPIGLCIVMLGAIFYTRAGGLGAFGLPLVTLAGLLSVLVSGPGLYAVSIKRKAISVN